MRQTVMQPIKSISIVCLFWPLYCISFMAIVLYVFVGHCIVCFFWPLYCMSFLAIVLYVFFGHCIVCLNKDIQCNGQKRHTIQWPIKTYNTMAKKDIQYNGQKRHTIQWVFIGHCIVCLFWPLHCMSFLAIVLYVFFGPCIVCLSSIDGFWSLLWHFPLFLMYNGCYYLWQTDASYISVLSIYMTKYQYDIMVLHSRDTYWLIVMLSVTHIYIYTKKNTSTIHKAN
jgi:hypothetical protein